MNERTNDKFELMGNLAIRINNIRFLLENCGCQSRELSIVKTKLEEAEMWLHKDMYKNRETWRD